MQKALIKFLLLLLCGYRYLISPMLGNRCRFYPSCSQYAQAALIEHGLLRGLWLALCRLSRCHPFSAGGYDPTPQPSSPKNATYDQH